MSRSTAASTSQAEFDAGEVSVSIPAPLSTLTLDLDLRICSITPGGRDLLGLTLEPVGYRLNDLADQLRDHLLVDHCRSAAQTHTPLEQDLFINGLHLYRRQILPFEINDAQVAGLLVTYIDITDRCYSGEPLRESEGLFRSIFERAASGIAQVSPDGRFRRVNDAMCSIYGYTREEFFELGYLDVTHPDDREAKRQQLGRILNGEIESFSLETRGLTKDGRTKWLHLTVAGVRDGDRRICYFVSILEDISRRKQAEARLLKMTHELERQVEQRTRSIRILQQVAIIANESETIAEAFDRTLECVCDHLNCPIGHVFLMNDDDPNRYVDSGIWYLSDWGRFHGLLEATRNTSFGVGEELIGTVAATGRPYITIDLQNDGLCSRRAGLTGSGMTAGFAFPILVQAAVVGVVELYSANEQGNWEAECAEGIADLGTHLGRVIERKQLDKRIADAATHEQQVLGRELHDTVAQALTGIGMLTERLRVELERDESPREPLAAEIIEHLTHTQRMVRKISHGVMPVDVRPEGLMTALQELADGSAALYGVMCQFVCPEPVLVSDSTASNQIYRIAQEGIHNAARHGRPDRIIIRLRQFGRSAMMAIEDNGVGFDGDPELIAGVGMRIMRHRAELANGEFLIRSLPGKGTSVACSFPIVVSSGVS